MRIQIKCRVSSLKINSAQRKSIDVNICDELRVCNTVGAWGMNLQCNQPFFFSSKRLTIENAEGFFDFMSVHDRETFLITLEKPKKSQSSDVPTVKIEKQYSKVSKGSNENVTENKVKFDDYEVVEVELIYG